jgi:butyryl-CoA dehydrogenase
MGGAGYVRDHPVERLFRDQRLNTIHEGTSGILAIDFVLRGVRRDGGAAFLQFLQEVICELGSIEGQNEAALSEALATCVSSIQECTAKLVAGSEDDARAWASPFSIFVGDTIVAWLWLRQIKALRGKIDGAAPAKRAASLCFIQLILKQSLAVSKNILDGMPAPYGELDPHFMVG